MIQEALEILKGCYVTSVDHYIHDNQTTLDNISKSDLYGETFLLA